MVPAVDEGVQAVHHEIRIMENFVCNPDACESVIGVAQLWLGGEDPLIISNALQNLNNCGLLHRFGEGERAMFYCVDVALVRAVLLMIKDRQKMQPIAEYENTIYKSAFLELEAGAPAIDH